MQTANEAIPEEIPVVPREELAQIDVEKHIGKKVKIEAGELKTTKYGLAVIYSTVIVETINPDSPNEICLRGTKLFGFNKDRDGKACIGEGSKLHMMMKEKKAARWQDLVGQEVILQTRVNNEGRKFLTF